jgi:hypothetical protein
MMPEKEARFFALGAIAAKGSQICFSKNKL